MPDLPTLEAPFYADAEHIAIELPGARALFTTRRGGVSGGPYASLNLGRLTDDESWAVTHNRALITERLGVTLAYGRQVHGVRVARVVSPPDPRAAPQLADGQATTLRGVAPMVFTADCLPVAVAGEGAVAMLHAGWRGLADGVIAEGARALRELGARGPLVAAIGPGAGPCCYEVGEEVHARFDGLGDGARAGRKLNLKAIAGRQLARAGCTEIHDVGLCTICSATLFFSHRRDRGITGRQAGIAWLT
jgi:YfiH family protein